MYLEEIKEKEHNGMNNNDETEANSPEKTHSPENSNRGLRATKQEKSFNPPPSNTASTAITASPTINFQNASGFSLIGALKLDGIAQFSPKKPRNEQNQDDFIGGLGGYPIGEIGRFTADQFQQQYSGNGVSLTLGLPHCETLAISRSHSHQSFQMGRGGELGEGSDYATMNPPSSSTAMYKILPDFVA